MGQNAQERAKTTVDNLSRLFVFNAVMARTMENHIAAALEAAAQEAQADMRERCAEEFVKRAEQARNRSADANVEELKAIYFARGETWGEAAAAIRAQEVK